jgi:hypothetical protein
MKKIENLIHFIETTAFTKRVDEYGIDVLHGIQDDLLENPTRGKAVAGTGGARKARFADQERNKGKRDGLRYMYYYFEEYQELYLLILYGKDEQDDLTKKQKEIVKGLVGKARNNLKEKYE